MHSADIQRGVMEWSGVECEGGEVSMHTFLRSM